METLTTKIPYFVPTVVTMFLVNFDAFILRITESGETRITEDGEERITE